MSNKNLCLNFTWTRCRFNEDRMISFDDGGNVWRNVWRLNFKRESSESRRVIVTATYRSMYNYIELIVC